MVKRNLLSLSLLSALGTTAALAQEDALMSQAQALFQPLPEHAHIEEANPDTTQGMVDLGRMLYFDPRLSASGNISCNTCHNLSTFGVDNLHKSPGVEAQLGGRNSPTVLNAALNATQFWDGRAQDVEEQAGGPLLNPVEMALADEQAAVDIVANIPGYVALFQSVYGEESAVTFETITQAIGAYERTLLTPSPFDAYLNGDSDALTAQQKSGLESFIANGCIACHQGVNLGGEQFQRFGLVDGPYWKFTGSEEHDDGRFEVTQAESDKYLFRVPTLRNVERTYPYFHDGSVASLHDAVAIMGQAQLGKQLPEQEIDDMVAFLSSLTGELSEEARTMPILPASVFEPKGLNLD